MPKIRGPQGADIEISAEAYVTWRRIRQVVDTGTGASAGFPTCVLEELVDGGHIVFHELLETGLVLLDVWQPGPINPEVRAN